MSMSKREQAARNMAIAAVNAGLEAKLFGLLPSENFWQKNVDSGDSISYHFNLFDIHCVANAKSLKDGGLKINVAAAPTNNTFQPLSPSYRSQDCKAFTSFFFDRFYTAGLQAQVSLLKENCTNGKHAMLTLLANGDGYPEPEPQGFYFSMYTMSN